MKTGIDHILGRSDRIIETLDMHTGGEPLRIVLHGFPSFPGLPVLEVRRRMKSEFDHYRKAIMWEPRGHADMYGLMRVEAEREDSAFGVLFMHNEGYSTMCGHATIALGRAAVDLGWVKAVEPVTRFNIDAPCGQVKVEVHLVDGAVEKVSFINVPSFYVGSYTTHVEPFGLLQYDLAYGGAFYAYVEASRIGFSLDGRELQELIKAGRLIKDHLMTHGVETKHPYQPDLSFLYGVIFIGNAREKEIHSRNVCVFADGELDRCATGSGISGRIAIEYANGRLPDEGMMTVESITGSTLSVEIESIVDYGGYRAVMPRVSGLAYYTGKNTWLLEKEDPFRDGFILR